MKVFIPFISLCFAGCASQADSAAQSNLPSSQITLNADSKDVKFVDLGIFDRILATSLNQSSENVEVSFHSRLTPNHLPDRLQNWMAAVESNGGKVDIASEANTASGSGIISKSPMLVISMIASLWNAKKSLDEIRHREDLATSKNYNAVLHLKRDANGDQILNKIVFSRKPKTQ